MRSSDYVWVMIDYKKPKSSRRNLSKSPCHFKNVHDKSKRQQKDNDNNPREADAHLQRIAQLQRQNKLLKKQNLMLVQYFYMQRIKEQQAKLNNQVRSTANKESRLREFKSEQKDYQIDATTMHSQERNQNRIIKFGNRKK